MSYFDKFPYTEYEANDKTVIVKDILRRTYFISEYKNYIDLFELYTIIDGETPSSVAYKYYGSANLHWVILLFNEIHDAYTEWPMSELTLIDFCKQKYPGTHQNIHGDVVDNMNKVYYYLKNGTIVGEFNPSPIDDLSTWVSPINTDSTALPVTFYDHEAGENESHRKIRLLRPELVSEFISQFEAAIIK